MHRVMDIPPLPRRPAEGHKGTFGKVLVIAGSRGMTGAAAIVGRAALRSGAGLVQVATPQTVQPIVASLEACYTTLPLPDEEGRISSAALDRVLDAVQTHDVVACGPGLGVSRGVCDVLRLLLTQEGKPLVLDADGLNALCHIRDWNTLATASMVLTPHPGEMRRLWQATLRDAMPEDRIEQAALLARCGACTVVLKGAGTVVTDGVRVYVNTTGNPGMATAGAGDVLTGVIAALRGQGLAAFDAAVLGVHAHGWAGDLAAARLGQMSLIATDLIDHLPVAFVELSRRDEDAKPA